MKRSRDKEHAAIPSWGVDREPEARPGVPKEHLPPAPLPHAHWETPPQQIPRFEVLKSADLAALTPVFGTAPPPHGASGALRRIAYRIPERRARRWMLLLFADRVDAVESDPLGYVRTSRPVVALAAAFRRMLARARERRAKPV
jgi:hypothetical protein